MCLLLQTRLTITEHSLENYPEYFIMILSEELAAMPRNAAVNSNDERGISYD